ncbi:MAG: hypothetical protein IH843_04975 [Thaumarchaeota archaeon]|nr:hypothetical protein [Nitrososphaerota archaeon]
MSSYKLDNVVSAKDRISLDKKIKNLVREKEKIEKNNLSLVLDPITKEDLEKLNFSEDLVKLKAIQRERLLEDLSTILNHKIKELEQKDQVLSELTIALDTKVNHLTLVNIQLEEEKKRSEDLNQNLKTTLKKLSDTEKQLKIERDWLAEQVEVKSIEVLKTIEQLIKAENAKSLNS